MNIQTIKLLIFSILLFVLFSCNEEKVSTFNLNANATVIFLCNNLSDSLTLELINFPIIESSVLDETFFVSEKASEKKIEIPCENPSPILIRTKELAFTAFIKPNDTLTVQIQLDDNNKIDTILFKGKTKLLCDYYWQKQLHLGYPMLMYQLIIVPQNTRAIKENTDTLMHNELVFLDNYLSDKKLPDWFINSERSQIIYECNDFKESQKPYFERYLKLPFNPDKDYYASIDTLLINNPKAIYSFWYFYFLKHHLVNKNIDLDKVKADEWMDVTTHLALIKAKENLSGDVRDIFNYNYLNSFLNKTKELNIYDEMFAKHKDDFSNQYYLDDLIKTRNSLTDSIVKNRNDGFQQVSINGLKANDSIPYFYLPDVNGVFYSPKQFEGKIIYINFWGTWCHACIASIPEKNALIEKYSNNENVVFLNICISSERKDWEKVVKEKKMGGINLFANENWSKILVQKFGVSEYPTYFLINEGKVIKPYCDYPDKIQDDINAILE